MRAPASELGDEITLYRDRAVIRKRIAVTVPDADHAIVTLQVPAGVDAEEVVVLDHGDLTVTQALEPAVPVSPVWKRDPRTAGNDARAGEETDEGAPEAPAAQPPPRKTGPIELRFVVTAPKAGRYELTFGYATDQLPWEAAYTLTTTPARTQISMRGAIAIRNTTGLTFKKARTFVIDGDLGSRERLAEQHQAALTSAPKERAAAVASARSLGLLTLESGETRVELLPGDPPRPARTVLVYDPIGTKLDHSSDSPIRDAKLGSEPPTPHVKEGLEIKRPTATNNGLPGGMARLLEHRPDGSLVLLGESRLFDLSTNIATADIVELRTADGVTGRRERREYSIDDDRKRLVEEFAVTVANTRAQPIDVVLREHLYRSQTWTLAYYTGLDAKQVGAQQISLNMRVPAKGEAKLFYVVVYTWK